MLRQSSIARFGETVVVDTAADDVLADGVLVDPPQPAGSSAHTNAVSFPLMRGESSDVRRPKRADRT